MVVKGWDANPKQMDKALYFLKEVHDISSANSSEISYSSLLKYMYIYHTPMYISNQPSHTNRHGRAHTSIQAIQPSDLKQPLKLNHFSSTSVYSLEHITRVFGTLNNNWVSYTSLVPGFNQDI